MNESRLHQLVHKMHEKFGLVEGNIPGSLTPEEKQFRVSAMLEELTEYRDSTSLVDEYDALLDLIVFAIGTLDRQCLPLLAGFEAVMKANMAKQLGQNGNKRGGFKRDLVKPDGWVGPEEQLAAIIRGVGRGTVAPGSDGKIVPGFAPKFDANKVRVDLLPIGPLIAIASVFTFGAQKYFANSYRTGETVAWSRTYGSILRHLYAFWSGEDKDPESGLHHLAHAGTQLMILMEHVANNKDKDDRFKRGDQEAA